MSIELELLTCIHNNYFKEQSLDLNEKELTDEDVILLVETLKNNRYIKRLNLENNFISSLGAQRLATLSILDALNLGGNKIGPEGAIALARSDLKEIDVASCPIGEGIAAFATSPLLISLNAEACLNLTDADVEPLFLSKSIKELNLACNKLSGKCLKNIVSNTVLESLDFARNEADDKDGCYYISQNNFLKRLDLSSTFIKDEEAILLAKSSSLKNLFLRGCFIKDKGALALSKNNHLEKLSLFQNEITEIGAKAFIDNTTLTYLSLVDNPFNAWNVMDLRKIYKEDREKVYVRTQEDIKTLLKKKNLI